MSMQEEGGKREQDVCFGPFLAQIGKFTHRLFFLPLIIYLLV